MGDLDQLAADWGATPWDGPLDGGGVAYAIEGPAAIGILTVQVRAGAPPNRTMVFLSMRCPQVEDVLDAWYAISGERPVAPWRVSVSRWAGDLLDLDVPVSLDAADDMTALEPAVAAGFAWLAARVQRAGDSTDVIATLRLDRHRSWQGEAVALRLAGRSNEATALVSSLVADAEAGPARRQASRLREFAEWFTAVETDSSPPPGSKSADE